MKYTVYTIITLFFCIFTHLYSMQPALINRLITIYNKTDTILHITYPSKESSQLDSKLVELIKIVIPSGSQATINACSDYTKQISVMILAYKKSNNILVHTGHFLISSHDHSVTIAQDMLALIGKEQGK